MKVIVALVLLAFAANAEKIVRETRYDGHAVLTCQNRDMLHAVAEAYDLDVWGESETGADVFVRPSMIKTVMENCDCEMVDVDVQALIDEETARLNKRSKNMTFGDDDWFTEYHTYDELKQWYADFAQANPNYVTFTENVGTTHEGRDIFAITITDKNSDKEKAQMYMQGLIHAREWISGATVNYISNELVKNTDLLETVEFIIIPVLNADGYAYSWSNTRLWRKNRRQNSANVFGVDLNRNFNDHWGQGGSSSNPNSDVYMGPSAASEPETQAATKVMQAAKNTLAMIDWHSYTQLVLRPYGWSTNPPPDAALLKEAGDTMRDIIFDVHGKTYRSIPSINLYKTTGSTGDYFYGDELKEAIGHRTYGYTMELRPASANPGFLLPPSEIIPTGEENYPIVEYLIKFAMDNPLSGN